ncbi:hypothetical protein CTI14_52850, partial [Methylobacterium radiotolerans]
NNREGSGRQADVDRASRALTSSRFAATAAAPSRRAPVLHSCVRVNEEGWQADLHGAGHVMRGRVPDIANAIVFVPRDSTKDSVARK